MEGNKIESTKKPFLKKKEGFINKKEVVVEELKEYVLMLMLNNGYTEIIEGVKPGKWIMQIEGTDKQKESYLSPHKTTTFEYNGQFFRGWVLYENNMLPYPEEPLYGAEMFRKIVQKVAMNYEEVNEGEHKAINARTKQIIAVVAVIGLIGYIVFSAVSGNGDTAQVTEVVAQNVSTIANNTGVHIG